ncbi:MAG: hypoxanthine phosphoribosyltransferase [Candidatus Neomarinimicrobiota bacterium]|nr:hypoxanthine phosphoribosyltransferase [Candidatus Neomarinimicrobiota bacterium]
MKELIGNMTLLFSKDDIKKRVSEIGQAVSNEFKGKDPIFIGVLNGSFMFMADLLRSLNIDCEMDFIKIRSYVGKSSSGTIQLIKDISADVTNRNVILVEDIIDSGHTIHFLRDRLTGASPKSISIITFLIKPDIAKLDFSVDFIGFEIPPDFVVGYGLDYNQKLRHLDAIYRLDEVIEP